MRQADDGRVPSDPQERAALLAWEIGERRVRHRSSDKTVTVEIAPGGALIDLELTPRALDRPGSELAELVRETIAEATASLNARVCEVAGRHGGRAGADAAALLAGRLPLRTGESRDDVPTPDSGLEPLERLRREAALRSEAVAQARRSLEEMTATGRSSTGNVEATVGAGGRIARLRIPDACLRHGASRVGPMVLGAVRAANARFATLLAERLHGLPGPRIDIGGRLAALRRDGV